MDENAQFERVAEDVVVIDGKHYKLMTDEEVAEFIWAEDSHEVHG